MCSTGSPDRDQTHPIYRCLYLLDHQLWAWHGHGQVTGRIVPEPYDMGKFEMQRFLEKLGLVSYILAFSAGLWAWPATFLAAWYIKSTIFRAFLVAYLAYIWIGPGRQQPGRADGPTFLKRYAVLSYLLKCQLVHGDRLPKTKGLVRVLLLLSIRARICAQTAVALSTL